ncbi:MAG: hypothetical protein HY367_02755 [Candidatus Aenigmarchaeota archaeon]|nr:hypothetical protein [Candidatus Aenigmarchaeota archaeon]
MKRGTKAAAVVIVVIIVAVFGYLWTSGLLPAGSPAQQITNQQEVTGAISSVSTDVDDIDSALSDIDALLR